MSTRTDHFIQGILDLVYLNTAFAALGDTSGLQPSATAGNIYAALETASGEADYTSYARKAIPRTASGFSRTGNVVSNVAQIDFAKATGGSNTVTKVALYDAITGGNKLHEETLAASIAVSEDVQPAIEAAELTITGS